MPLETHAGEQSERVTSQGAGKAREVAGTAKEQAGAVAEQAAAQAGTVMDEAKAQASHVVDDAKQQLRGQAVTQTDKVADGLERLHGQARALVEGNRADAGPLADYADEAVDKLAELASTVRSRGFDGLLEDTQRFARRRPGMFLAGAAAVGFLAGRVARSAKDTQDREPGSTNGYQPRGAGYGYGMVDPGTPPPPTAAMRPLRAPAVDEPVGDPYGDEVL